MTSAKLGEICTIVSGGTPSRSKSEYWINGTIPWIKIGNIKGKYVVNADENITELGLEKSSAKFLKKGTILYTIFATLGEVGILNIDACTNQAIAGITIKDTTIIGTDFLYYYLKSKKQYVDRIGRGVAQNNINMSILRNFDVPLLSLEKQKDIVSTLDTLQSIITHRRTQLEKLDLLVKARFVEMFVGKGYPLRNLDSLSLGKGEYGAQSASVEYDESRPRYVRITDINDDGTLNDDYVSSVNIDDDKNYKLSYGDFLFARMGATVGKTYAYLEGNQIYAGYLIRYRLNQNLINPRYLYSYTKLEEYNEWVKLNQSGAAQPGINAKKYGSLLIPVPPLELQTQFADFVKQVDKSKATVQKALDEAQLLFDSLMQEYFG